MRWKYWFQIVILSVSEIIGMPILGGGGGDLKRRKFYEGGDEKEERLQVHMCFLSHCFSPAFVRQRRLTYF